MGRDVVSVHIYISLKKDNTYALDIATRLQLIKILNTINIHKFSLCVMDI